MIEPSKVKKAFEKVEDENYKFRAYLKNYADIDELNEQFHQLHKELFSNYDCSKCRNCCREYIVTFEEEELETAAAFVGMTKEDFIGKYIEERSSGKYALKMRPCCFLTEDGECQIEACKPASCREYPFTDKPERLFRLLGVVEASGVCPIVFEMLERLKQMYHFWIRRYY